MRSLSLSLSVDLALSLSRGLSFASLLRYESSSISGCLKQLGHIYGGVHRQGWGTSTKLVLVMCVWKAVHEGKVEGEHSFFGTSGATRTDAPCLGNELYRLFSALRLENSKPFFNDIP